ncbi:MAG: GPW/gp25 family protein [Bacteroidales bacterium]|jgi:phage baseplate assembly protein W
MAINHIYSDLDLTFLRQPGTGDVSMKYDEQSVIRSVRNLLSTNLYERLFQPTIGSTLNQILFEPVSTLTALQIEDEIVRMIKNYEPRATISQINVSASPDDNSFSVSLWILIGNQTTPTAISLILTRTR